MELNAKGSLNNAAQLAEDNLGTATQTYVVEAFSCFNPDHLQQFPVELTNLVDALNRWCPAIAEIPINYPVGIEV
ncbi:hypothetical protein YC2023_054417 [Brassica napus]